MHLEGLKSTASLQLLLIREDVPFELQLIGTLYQNLSKFKFAVCPSKRKNTSFNSFMSKSFSPTLW